MTPREDRSPLSPGVAMIKGTKWRYTQDLYAGRSLKAGGFKTTTNSLKNFFIVDAKEQFGDMIWPRHGSKGRGPPGAADEAITAFALSMDRTQARQCTEQGQLGEGLRPGPPSSSQRRGVRAACHLLIHEFVEQVYLCGTHRNSGLGRRELTSYTEGWMNR